MTRRRPTARRSNEQTARPDVLSTAPETVAERLRQADCDPITAMVILAQDEDTPVAMRARIFMELATYIAPRRRAVDLTGKEGSPLDLGESFDPAVLTDEELRKTMQEKLWRQPGKRS